jgi:hypothetical protein
MKHVLPRFQSQIRNAACACASASCSLLSCHHCRFHRRRNAGWGSHCPCDLLAAVGWLVNDVKRSTGSDCVPSDELSACYNSSWHTLVTKDALGHFAKQGTEEMIVAPS